MSRVRSIQTVLLTLAALFCFSFQTFAQSDTASISGLVKDVSSAIVPNASVVIKNEQTGVERRAKSNDSGNYIITNLPPGLYTVTVEAAGFKRYEKTGNKLDPSISTTVNADLQVGSVAETVEVTATAVTLQSESATLGKVITNEQIKYTNLNGRNPIFLALLKPGVRGGSLAGLSFGLDSGNFNINGSRSQDNLITFDGAVGIRTRSNGTSIGVADLDAVQEVQVLTANYNAEYGRSSGGQIRIVTKSGTREFHGTAYEYFRNSALNANSWSRNRTIGNLDVSGAPPAERYNQYGFNVNGPVFIPGKVNRDRNKLFFLFSEEWIKRRRADTTITTVPSLKMRTGDFSELLVANNGFFSSAQILKDPKTGIPFEGNRIPPSQQSRNGLAFLRGYPEPTPGFFQGTSNFVQQRPTTTDQRKDTGALDWNPSEKHFVRFRVQNFAFVDVSAFRGGTDRAPQIIDRPNRTGSLNYIWTISPTMVNEALITGSVDRVYIAVDTRGNTFQRSKYGIDYKYLFPDRKEIFDKIPTIKLNGPFTDLDGGPYPSSSTGPIYNISDNFTKIKGNHTYKFGFLFERSGQNDFDQINVAGVPGGTNNQNGRFEFTDARTGGSGLGIANAALGLFTTYAEIGVRSFTPYRGQMYEWFAQDGWKVTPKLRLEYGLRHSIIKPYYSLWRNLDVFDSTFYDPAKAVRQDPKTGFIVPGSGDQYNGVVIPGTGFTDAAKGRVPAADSGEFNRLFHGVDKRYSNTHYKDFQPRLGLAYQLNPKTVLRSGVGRFVTRLGVSDSVFLGGNPPFQPLASISDGLADSPGGGSNNLFAFGITTQDKIFPNPSAWTWNATVERELPFATTVEISYVGRRGLHAQRERNINQLLPGTIQANPGVNADFLRPYKGFGTIRSTNNEANSTYNGLQVGLTRRYTKGLLFGLAYTLSKSSDDGSGQRDVIPNTFDAHNLWGPSTFDTRHVAVINVVYDLPIFRNHATLVGKTLGGWQISAVTQFQTGTPNTVATGDDFAGVGPGSGSQIWNVNGNATLDNGNKAFSYANSDSNFWFATKNPDGSPIFTRPAAGTFTTQRNRDIIYSPGFQNWNMALLKSFYVTEKHSVQFRFEAFNWNNHPNWNGADFNPTSATFGKVTGKGSERNLQLNLRYSF